MKYITLFILVMFLSPAIAIAEDFQSGIDPELLRDVKQTPQGKYMTSEEAFDLLTKDPDILFVDVRDPVEVVLNGHPSLIDAVVPVRAQSTVFDEQILEWELKDNPNFFLSMEKTLVAFGKSRNDMIIITCGSGWRSAVAARKLHDAGYTDVWHITDGYDGEEKRGFNSENAWKLAGLPWSYDQVPGTTSRPVIK